MPVRPGGRAVLAMWGERVRCGWALLFGIVDAEVRSEVRPLFFGSAKAMRWHARAPRRACASPTSR